MLEVIHVLYAFHQHIVDVNFHCALNQALRDLVNHSLECSPYILESEGHHLVAADSLISSEGCLVFVQWMHIDLIIPRIGVHEVKKLVAHRYLY